MEQKIYHTLMCDHIRRNCGFALGLLFREKGDKTGGIYRVIKPFCAPAVYSSRARNSVNKFATHGHTPEISLYSPILEAFTIWSMF